MQLFMRMPWRHAAALVLMMWGAPVLACSCGSTLEISSFLHLSQDRRILLPANALGILYNSESYRSTYKQDYAGNEILNAVPRKLEAKHFVIRDLTAARRVEAVVTPLPLAWRRNYFLIKEGAPAEGEVIPYDDLRPFALKHGLRDITKDVMEGHGLFRIAPLGGFIEGHEYEFYGADLIAPYDKAKVTIGPRIHRPAGERYKIALAGLPAQQLLDFPKSGVCSAQRPMLVQHLNYVLPKAHEPYREFLIAYTAQQMFGRDLQSFRAEPDKFAFFRYYPALCFDLSSYATAPLERGKDLAFTDCPAPGVLPDRRLVRGLVGILELDNSLQDTGIVEVHFATAEGDACTKNRATSAKDK